MWRAIADAVLGPKRSVREPGEWALLGARVFCGLSMAFLYGADKFPPSPEFVAEVGNELGFPLPAFFAWSAGAAEFIGGLALAAGAGVRIASFFLVVTMLVAAYIANAGEPLAENMLAHLFGLFFIVFLLRGGGILSLDAAVRAWLSKRPAPTRSMQP